MRGPRFQIRSLMILVAVSALFFAAMAWLTRVGVDPSLLVALLVGGLFPVGIFAMSILFSVESQ